MNETHDKELFTHEEKARILAMLNDYESRRAMRAMIRATVRTWVFWITLVAAIAGGVKSWWSDLLGRH